MGFGDPLVFAQALSTNGDGTGDTNANGDYSVTPGEFYIQPQGGDRIEIHRLIVTIEDDAAFDVDGYGAIAALTNGMNFEIRRADNTTVIAALQLPLKTNLDWGSLCYDINYHQFGGGAAHNALLVRWTFSKHGGPIILENGQILCLIMNDDLQGLHHHGFVVQGAFVNRKM